MAEIPGHGAPNSEAATASGGPVSRSDFVAFLARFAGMKAGQIRPSMALGAGLGLDSLGVVDLLTAMNVQLGVNVDGFLADETTTVEELAAQLRREQQPRRKRPARPAYRAGRWPLSRPVVAIRAALQLLLLQPLLGVLSRRRVHGLERLRRMEGPALFVANHLSLLDNPAVMVSLPWRWRLRLATAASDEVLDDRGKTQRFLAILISNAFPLSQTRSVRRSIQYCRELTGQGWSLLYFPEGMRSDDGSILPFKRGVGLLAVELEVPVVPVHLKGTDEVMPKGGSRPRRGIIEVRFGQPLRFNRQDTYAGAADTIREAIASLSGETIP